MQKFDLIWFDYYIFTMITFDEHFTSRYEDEPGQQVNGSGTISFFKRSVFISGFHIRMWEEKLRSKALFCDNNLIRISSQSF